MVRQSILCLCVLLLGVATPPAADVAAQTRESPPQLQEPWWNRARVVRSRHYQIKSDLTDDALRELATHLDATFEAYISRLGELRQNAPTSFDVLIFADQKDYLTTLSYRYGINAAGSGGMFFQSAGNSALAFWTGNLPARRVHHVLQHEGFHQIAHAFFPGNLPQWLNEGLAEFFGEGIFVGRKLVIGQTNPRVIAHVREAIENNEHIRFRQMLTMDGRTWNSAVQSGDARLQYEQAWSMVHFLIYGDDGKYAVPFSNFLRYLNAGMNAYDSFVRAFGTDDIESFEQRWIEHAMAQRPSSFVTALERIEFLAAGLLELSTREIYPETLDELRDKLQAIDFTYTLSNHGIETTFRADDDALYRIPLDDLSIEGEPPAFLLEPTDVRVRDRKHRLWEQEHPTPFTIRTESLRPNNVCVQWLRNPEDGELSFGVVVN